MVKAVIFDMFETLITHFQSPPYFGKQIAEDMNIPEAKLREIWDPTDYARTIGKMTLEDVFEQILKANNKYDAEQEGSKQPVWRMPEFKHAESPLEVLWFLNE